MTWRDNHLSDTYFEFLVWPLSHRLTWRGQDLFFKTYTAAGHQGVLMTF